MSRPERVSLLSILVNVLLVGVKSGLAALSGSIALMADAVHSLADVISSASVFAGLRLSQRKSPQFPYGLYKVENLVSLGSAAFIFIAAYEIARSVLTGHRTVDVHHVWPCVGGLLVVVGITFAFSRYEHKAADESRSPSLRADAAHILTDTLSSVVILASFLGRAAGLRLDTLAALIVVAFIAWSGWQIAKGAIRTLLDASVEPDVLSKVRQIAERAPGVSAIRSVAGRNSGSYRFIEVHVVTDTRDLEKAHGIATELEAVIRSEVAHVDRVAVYYEPTPKEEFIYAFPSDGNGRIADELGEAPEFVLLRVGVDGGEIRGREVVPNTHRDVPRGKGILVAEDLVAHGADFVVLRQAPHGKGPLYVLRDAGTKIVMAKGDHIPDASAELALLEAGEAP
jgi:cation diffusion facilitator family transporter